ncbi:hypothetical protein ScPMuIL_003184 [Solemya velum]
MGLMSDGLEKIVSLYNGYFVVIGIDCQNTVYVRDGDDMRLNCTGGNGVQVKWYIKDDLTSVLLTINAAINPNEPDFTVRLSVTYNEPPGQYTLVRTSFNNDTDSGVYSCKVGDPPYPTFSVRSPETLKMTVRKYPILLIILFQCYGLIQSVILPLEIEGGCGVAHKETKLQCSDITAANPQDVDWIGPPNGLSLLKSDGAPIDPIKHAVTIQTNAFFLIINDTDASDPWNVLVQLQISRLTSLLITDHIPPTPQVTVKDKDGKDVPGTFVDDSTVTGLVKRIVWKTTSSTVAATPTTESPPLSDGAIAGIIVGSLLFVGLVIGGGLVLYKKKIICVGSDETDQKKRTNKNRRLSNSKVRPTPEGQPSPKRVESPPVSRTDVQVNETGNTRTITVCESPVDTYQPAADR